MTYGELQILLDSNRGVVDRDAEVGVQIGSLLVPLLRLETRRQLSTYPVGTPPKAAFVFVGKAEI